VNSEIAVELPEVEPEDETAANVSTPRQQARERAELPRDRSAPAHGPRGL